MGRDENFVEGYLVKEAEKLGFLCLKGFSENGFPDRIVIGNGQVVFVETKSSTGHVRPLQKSLIKRMRLRGATVYTPKTRDEIDEILKGMAPNAYIQQDVRSP